MKRQLRYISDQNLEKDDVIRDLEIRVNILEDSQVQDNKSKAPLIDIDALGSNYTQNHENEKYSIIERQKSPMGLYENSIISQAKKSELDINKSFLHQDSMYKDDEIVCDEDEVNKSVEMSSNMKLKR